MLGADGLEWLILEAVLKDVRELKPGAFHVEVQLYAIRESLVHESAWESNPPAKFATPPTGFEDQDSHRATSALAADSISEIECCQFAHD